MRGYVDRQQSMFVALDIEVVIPDDHPLRAIKTRCDRVLAAMSRDFKEAYGTTGRVGIPPESLLKALLLGALFAIPSERRLCEACEYNLLYRWFIDWPIERDMWTPEAFSMNRERFESRGFARKFFDRVVAQGLAEGVIGDDRFSVDGTLIRSPAGHKSPGPIDENPAKQGDDDDDLNSWGGFKGKKRSNATHRSVVDPDALLKSKGGETHPSHSLHVLADSRSGMCLSVSVDRADGNAERRNAVMMVDRVERRQGVSPKKLAADAGYGTGDYLCEIESRGITPHSAMPKTPIKGETARHDARRRMRRRHGTEGYRVSRRLRRQIEPVIGWLKHVGGLARTRFIGHERIQDDALMVGLVWNLMKLSRLT